MRYGENPHQRAAFYRDEAPAAGSHRHVSPAAGQGALVQQRRRRRRRMGVRQDARRAGVRHRQARESLRRRGRRRARSTPIAAAFATDPTSAFGGIIAFNRAGRRRDARGGGRAVPRGADCACLHRRRAGGDRAQDECPRARGRAARRIRRHNALDLERVGGGFLVQTPDTRNVVAAELKVVTKTAPTAAQVADLLFAWRVAKFVKSNAIVYCGNGRTLGDRRRADEPRRFRPASPPSRPRRRGCRSPARSSRPTPSFRSATASTSSPTRRDGRHPARRQHARR